MQAEAAPTPYDLVPYPAGFYRQTHPDRLESLAQLFEMNPPDARRCRVLELGCADGGNLIPMACARPDSTFVGVDLSKRQIESGRTTIAALGLTNIELRHCNICDVDASFGTFDYIIAHGVYSWVPSAAQEAMLALCRDRLCENGVAYISYNTYPGWRMRGMLRDMMLYHASKFDDPQQQIEQARALIQWLSESVRTEDSPYGALLRSELEQMRRWQDTYFRHDSLAEFNEPIYFHQFVERAERHGLQYLAEAEFPAMLANNCPPTVTETLNRLGRDIIELEQYMDFVRNRLFRQTLLCHRGIRLNRSLGPWSPSRFHIVASLVPTRPGLKVASAEVEVFQGPNEMTLSTSQPIVKAALVFLRGQWPVPVAYQDALKEALALVRECHQEGSETTKGDQILGGALLTCYMKGLCEFHTHSGDFVLTPGSYPRACPYARLQAAHSNFVTNRRHERVGLDKFGRHLLPLLDGEHDHESLTETLVGLVIDGALKLTVNDRPVVDREETRKTMSRELELKLAGFGRNALLIA